MCFFVGKDFYSNKKQSENFHFYNTFDDFVNDFKQHHFQNKIILIKGSRGMALERTLELI